MKNRTAFNVIGFCLFMLIVTPQSMLFDAPLPLPLPLLSRLVGNDLLELKDPEGKFMAKMAIEVAKTNDKGWTENYEFNQTTENL